ncbi:three-helix bundle dimerization domain-containing protein [Corynebacterium sp. A21]|uniref:three-helix bundle dimerization domain-containing protein n=1 Tax=Corynebacterium sp. A21 TaxID=3457318 RepID=UPI003FD38C93
MFPINKTAGNRKDVLWSLREDLQARFGNTVESHLIDSLLDSVAAEFDREGGIGAFRKVLIERRVTAELESGSDLNYLYADFGHAA